MSERSPDGLSKRVGVAAVGIPLAVGLGYLGGYWLAGFLALLAAAGAWEFYAMHRHRGVAAFPLVGGLLASALVLLAVIGTPDYASSITVLALALGAPALLLARTESRPALAGPVTLFGALYTGGLLAFAVWLRALGGPQAGWRGASVLFLPVALTWVGDTAAYTVGRTIGRRRLAPSISPGKTWEGAIGGLIAGVGAAFLYVELTRPVVDWTLSPASILGFGALISVAGQVGDLVESRLKRDCGVKDSSNLLPGHGGVLDRLDSLLFAFPFGYAYLRALGL